MSSLYETPAERAQRLSQSTSTGNFFQDTFTDYVSSGISLGEDGKVKREGLAWWLQGLTPGARSIAEQKKGLENSKIIERQVQDSGLTQAQIKDQLGGGKLTVGNVSGTIAEAQRTRAEKPTPLQQKESDRRDSAEQRAIQAQEDATELGYRTLESQDKRYAHTAEQRDKERAHERRENNLTRLHQEQRGESKDALQMKIALMQNDLAEKRMEYDRETRRLDKRSQAIAQLMSGLGSLGGAFSL